MKNLGVRHYLSVTGFANARGNYTLKEISEGTGLDYKYMMKVANGDAEVSPKYIEPLCKFLNVDKKVLFEELDLSMLEQGETQFQLSENVIVGVKRNIENRLKPFHTRNYIDNIMELIDRIVVESAWLGVYSNEQGVSDFIRKKVIETE